MSNATPQDAAHDRLIEGLASDLRPVQPLPSPGRRAMIWLGFVIVAALLLSLIADLSAFAQRFMASPDMWLAMLGSALTALLAAIAAFQSQLAGQRARLGLAAVASRVALDRRQRTRLPAQYGVAGHLCSAAWRNHGMPRDHRGAVGAFLASDVRHAARGLFAAARPDRDHRGTGGGGGLGHLAQPVPSLRRRGCRPVGACAWPWRSWWW